MLQIKKYTVANRAVFQSINTIIIKNYMTEAICIHVYKNILK